MIPFQAVEWDDPNDPGGNVRHVAAHGLTTDEVEDVLYGSGGSDGWSRSSNRPMRIGWTSTGRKIIVVYAVRQSRVLVAIRPITAYEVP